MTMKKNELTEKAIETLKRLDTLTKPVVISQDKRYLNIALVSKTCNTIETILTFSLEHGFVRKYDCASTGLILIHQCRAYDKLADELQEMAKELSK